MLLVFRKEYKAISYSIDIFFIEEDILGSYQFNSIESKIIEWLVTTE